MAIRTISPLAKFHPLLPPDKLRTVYLNPKGKLIPFKKRTMPVWGVCSHSAGRGVPSKAKAKKLPSILIALTWYARQEATCPNYVIDELGDIYAVTDELYCAPHCGVDEWQRAMMLDGEWVHEVSPEAFGLWRRRWPDFKSPQHLFPGAHANWVYAGIEVIPQLGGNFPIFSDASYHSLYMLKNDIALRNGINLSIQQHDVHHEDLDPFDRWDNAGGWDPGALRVVPWFDVRRLK